MRKFLFIIPIILLAAACNKPTAQVQPASNPPAQESQQQQVPGYETAPDMSGWQAYTNTKYGFSVKHPQDYTIQEKSDSVVLSNADYVLTFTKLNDTIRNQISARISWDLKAMASSFPGPAEIPSQNKSRLYRFSYFTGDISSFNRKYLFYDHALESPGDEELGNYNMVAVEAEGNSGKDNAKAKQEGITNLNTYAYQPDFILATFKFIK